MDKQFLAGTMKMKYMLQCSSKTFSLKPTEEQCVFKVTVLTCWFDILLAWEAVDEYTRSVYIIR